MQLVSIINIDWNNFHQVLASVYKDMMSLCEDMINVAKGLAGLGALFYIAYRVWQSMARTEPIDVFPLLRPFALGLCIMFFPTVVLGTMDSILSPIAKATAGIVETQTIDLHGLQEEKDRLELQAMLDNPNRAFLVSQEAFDKKIEEMSWGFGMAESILGMHMQRAGYNVLNWIRQLFREIMENILLGASLCLDTVRTFYLLVLAIFGPISFAFAVYDGFQNTLTFWLSKYICVWLWLPVADMFNAILTRIQSLMVTQEIAAMQNVNYIPETSNTIYIIFFMIGIIGFLCVPTVAGWIVQAGGVGNYGKNVNSAISKGGAAAAGLAGSIAGNIRGNLKNNTMEFKSLNNIESSFKHLRIFGSIFLCACTLVCGYTIWKSYSFAEAQRQKIYVLDEGKSLMLALAQDASQNRPAEGRAHVERFHELFFTLSPDKSAIESNMERALLMSDKSAYSYYNDLREKGYYNRIIAGNIIQRFVVDSISCNFNTYPYDVITHGKQYIIRQSNVTERSLISSCRLLNTVKSDYNPQGFIIEAFEVKENKDIRVYER